MKPTLISILHTSITTPHRSGFFTPDKIKTVLDSFDRVFPVKEELAQSFYQTLFDMVPGARPMFPEDMTSRRLKLSDTLSYTVRNHHRQEVVDETIVGRALRHIKYGALPEHFASSVWF